MKLMTDAQREQLLANGRESAKAATEDRVFDPMPVVKLFTLDANATWLLSEIDPREPDRAFGLCDLGLGTPELGYVSLAVLTTITGPLKLHIERDRVINADQPLSAYTATARRDSRHRLRRMVKSSRILAATNVHKCAYKPSKLRWRVPHYL